MYSTPVNVFPFLSRSWSELTDIWLNRVCVNEVKLYMENFLTLYYRLHFVCFSLMLLSLITLTAGFGQKNFLKIFEARFFCGVVFEFRDADQK